MSGPVAILLVPWRILRRHWAVLLAAAALVYFTWHGINGNRGLLAWFEVSRGLERARAELARLEAERRRLEAPVAALQPDRADPDLIEEHLRRLGYVGEGELILLSSDPATAR